MTTLDLLVLNAIALVLFVGPVLLADRLLDILDTWFAL